jgi:hypothetical protein
MGLGLTTIAVAALVAFSPRARAADGPGFVVVVNQRNPLVRFGRADIAKLFLRRTVAWPGGLAATPCDLSGTSPIRKAFSEGVHSKPMWVIVAYWQQEIASGRSLPPAVCASEDVALQAVRDDPGAIAYVAEDTPLGAGVKILLLVR